MANLTLSDRPLFSANGFSAQQTFQQTSVIFLPVEERTQGSSESGGRPLKLFHRRQHSVIKHLQVPVVTHHFCGHQTLLKHNALFCGVDKFSWLNHFMIKNRKVKMAFFFCPNTLSSGVFVKFDDLMMRWAWRAIWKLDKCHEFLRSFLLASSKWHDSICLWGFLFVRFVFHSVIWVYLWSFDWTYKSINQQLSDFSLPLHHRHMHS